MTETKPTYSKGAWRTARALHKKIGWTNIEPGTICIGVTCGEAAQIIYDETRQDDWQELLEATKDIESHLMDEATNFECRCQECFGDVPRLQAAIKRVEEE